MPPLTRWFVKTSFVCLGLALIAGLLTAAQSTFGLAALAGLFPVYIHLFVLGWVTQLIFGVVFWMFPKSSTERPRGNETMGWWTYILLNAGLLLRVVAEPVNSVQPGALAGWGLVMSATLQFLAGLMFVLNSWARVREK
jgi:hypothetical protein